MSGGTGGTTSAAGPPGPTLTWQAREWQPEVAETDVAADILHWVDPSTSIPYIFMTGYQTTSSGATVIATHKYLANGDGDPINNWVARAFWPEPAIAVGTNKGVAMAIDPSNGTLYVVGEVNGITTGQDYITIPYTKDLGAPLTGWTTPNFYHNALANGDDVPVDIA
ncbi:MAG: hypothetical protein IIB26_10115, partial [Chloroflexi bacterium]|nr:hypothetical protein [Chloroflexota bacterium]